MFDILRASLRTGIVTTHYPDQPDPAPPAYRGLPELTAGRCDGTGACVEVCPSGAISLPDLPGSGRRWQIDLARCVFCGLCQETCPSEAITLTNEFELAVRRREDLIRQTPLDHASETVPQRSSDSPRALGQRFRGRVGRLLRRSLHIRHLDAGSDNSTDWEISALLGPVYDIQRLGIDVVASPRHADLLLVTGAVTRNLEEALLRTYEAMPEPRLVVAAGTEACGGGVLQGSYAVRGGVDRCLPVDVYIPGDPPRPQALIQGLLVAIDRMAPRIAAAP